MMAILGTPQKIMNSKEMKQKCGNFLGSYESWIPKLHFKKNNDEKILMFRGSNSNLKMNPFR